MPESAVLEAMGSARSMRWLKTDPVGPELIEQLIWAGTRASSPNNTQPWDFVVAAAPEVKARIQDAIMRGSGLGSRADAAGGPQTSGWTLPADPVARRTVLGARNIITTLDSIPAIIFVCATNTYPAAAPAVEMAYSAIYAAAQNMVVAARALGLGAAFTTFHRSAEPEIREILGIPADRILGVTMPVGWPARPFGPVARRPVDEVLHHDHW